MKTLFALGPAAVVLVSLTVTPVFAQTKSECAAAAAQARANPALGIMGGTGRDYRMSAVTHIDAATNAAAAGNESECWHQLRLSDLFVETGGPLHPKPTTESAGVQAGDQSH